MPTQVDTRMHALVASGTGRYADPWHPYPDTSPRIAAILRDAGFSVEIEDDLDRAMTGLDDVGLLVVNAGDPWRGDGPGDVAPASIAGFAAALERGIGVMAFHAALATMRDYPEWAPTIGGMWVPGSSWHPEHGSAVVHGVGSFDGRPVDDFEVVDEQYLRLQPIGRSTTVAEHAVDGERFPAVWVREVDRCRVVVDTLGHDERSYDSPGHRALVARLARWAVG